MLFTSVIAAALPLLATASPLLKLRAGGPEYVPIPANCTIMNPLPHASKHRGNGTIDGYMLSQTFVNASAVYTIYLEQPDYETINERWAGCLEQCNGFTGCVSAFLGYSVPTPVGYYGTAGGVPSVACMFFNAYPTPLDFIAAPTAQYVNETVGNIYCPS